MILHEYSYSLILRAVQTCHGDRSGIGPPILKPCRVRRQLPATSGLLSVFTRNRAGARANLVD